MIVTSSDGAKELPSFLIPYAAHTTSVRQERTDIVSSSGMTRSVWIADVIGSLETNGLALNCDAAHMLYGAAA